jgi:fructose-1,6-bisphosphatase/inositol monophosphatase family enzyme/GNAT superfamily N-acetyltransferase
VRHARRSCAGSTPLPESVALRPAAWNDREAILALTLAMGGHDDVAANSDPLRHLAALLRRSDARVVVAEVDGFVAGFAEIQARPTSIGDAYEAWLGALAVADGFRGRGIGSALLRAVDDAARELGCSRIELESSEWRDEAHAFYRERGYDERTPARRFRRQVPERRHASLEERFLDAAARAATAVASAIVDLAALDAVGMGADGAPTEAGDRAAERAAVEALAPLGVPIVSEERGLIGAMPRAGDAWIALDPLDGSRNFRAGYPPYATAIGLVRDGRPLAGFVCELVSGRRWSARVGAGAFADGRSIAAKRGTLLGLPSPTRERDLPRPPGGVQRIRVSGSTSIDLCRVADGSLGAFVALERGVVHVHDLAGPLAILVEAGAAVVDRAGNVPVLEPDPAEVFHIVAAADAEFADTLRS